MKTNVSISRIRDGDLIKSVTCSAWYGWSRYRWISLCAWARAVRSVGPVDDPGVTWPVWTVPAVFSSRLAVWVSSWAIASGKSSSPPKDMAGGLEAINSSRSERFPSLWVWGTEAKSSDIEENAGKKEQKAMWKRQAKEWKTNLFCQKPTSGWIRCHQGHFNKYKSMPHLTFSRSMQPSDINLQRKNWRTAVLSDGKQHP